MHAADVAEVNENGDLVSSPGPVGLLFDLGASSSTASLEVLAQVAGPEMVIEPFPDPQPQYAE